MVYVKKLALKCVKTMAQTAVGVIGSSAVLSAVDWRVCLSSVILSGVLCVLMNLSELEVEA